MRRLLTIKRVMIFILGIVIIAGGVYVVLQPRGTGAESAYTVGTDTITSTISFSGEIAADERAVVSFGTGGKLAWVGVKTGDRVVAGQRIASLDQAQLRKQLQKSLNNYDKTRRSFDQTVVDTSKRTVRDEDTLDDQLRRVLESAQFDLNNSVIDVELTQLAIDYAHLSSPIAGIVTRLDMPYPGVNVSPAQQIEIINPDTLYFSALVDQTDIASVREGMNGSIVLDAYPDETFSGSVRSVSFTPKAGETGTVYEAKVYFTSAGIERFRIGMTGDATFVLDKKKNVVAIPARFIKTEGDSDYVFKKVGSSREKTRVQTGTEAEGIVEIADGLKPGDIIYEFGR